MDAHLDLTSFIRPGDTILVGGATGEPRSLVELLIAQRHAVGPVTVFVGPSYTGLFQPEHADGLRFRAIGGAGTTTALTRAGVVDVVPAHLGSVAGLIASRRLPVDVVMAQMTPPDEAGVHSLGLIADYLHVAIAGARVTLAEINPRVPRTLGETGVPAARITAVVHDDRPLVEVEGRPLSPEDQAIGAHIAALVPDGATLQVGIGGTPDAVLAALRDHRDLGVHSGLANDAMVDLVECGALNNSRKEIDQALVVAGALYGTQRLYRWADGNPMLSMRPVSYTHNARVLSAFASLFAINSAIEVDLTGQVNAEMVDGRHVGVIGGQGAFARAGLMSERGRSIIALPSTARAGQVSRVVARVADGVVTTPRADADLVVTEHGVADLRGASVRERALRMIAISHPDHREALARAAHELPTPR